MGTAFLDLLGVLLLGLVGALSITTLQSQPPPPTAVSLADRFGLQDLDGAGLVLALAGAAAAVLLTKSIVSSYLTRRVFIFLANRQALVSARLTKELLSRPLSFIYQRSSQETAYALITGAGSATSMVLGLVVVAATEAALLVVLGVALLFLSPWIALGAIGFFAIVGLALQRAMGSWASRAGEIAARADIASLNAVQEAVGAYREITVSDRREMYVDRIQELRWRAARVAADAQFIGMFPKYMFEAALVVGGFALAAVLFSTQDSEVAVGTLALFLAAGTRVMPSLLRLQTAALGLRGAAGAATPTFQLATELGNPTEFLGTQPDIEVIRERIARGHPEFQPDIVIQGVSYTYPQAVRPALDNVTLSITAGSSLALVGRSGAGKSTLADVVLGVLNPDWGSVRIGGVLPSQAVKNFPGAFAYVPQDVLLANDTIRANVALGLPDEAIDDEAVWYALERAHLAQYLKESRQGLETLVGERGVRLSGGQRQRLGIARALYSRPKLLVLDEATSALDAETEEAITRMVSELSGEVTLIIVAHRLSTVRHASTLVYLEDGAIVDQGTFDDLIHRQASFHRQAELMGLANKKQ